MTKLKKSIEPATLKKQKFPELHLVIENAMFSFKEQLGEKKYQNRISKAVKLLMHGLNKSKTVKPTTKKIAAQKAPKKISAPIKKIEHKKAKVVATKKVAIKKAIKK